MAEQPHDIRRRAKLPNKKEPRTGVVVRLDIPPDHHPAVVRGDSPGANTGRSALTALYEAYGKINDTALQVTDKARLASAAQPFAERALDSAGRALTTLHAQRDHLDAEIAAAITPRQSDTTALEIRGYWQSKSSADGAKALTALVDTIKAGDAATTAAVLSAPAYLSGLSEEQQGLMRKVAAETVAPEQVAARAETVDALERVGGAVDHFTQQVAASLREWRDEDSKIIEENLR